MSDKDIFITTVDNPWNYFTQFDDWLNFDNQHGYRTLEKVGSIAKLSPDLSEEDVKIELERTIDFIIEWNGPLYKKIYSN